MKRGTTDLCLVLAVDKPSGMTSHDVVSRARRIFGEKRIAPIGTVMCSLVIIVAFAASAVALPGLF